jgi:membrane protein DedA with SNARE-associated domain
VAVALGAFLARRGEVSVTLLGVLCWLSNLASAAFMYFFARARGALFFREGWGRKVMPPEVLSALQHAYDKWGVAGIFVSRFLPGLRAGVTPFAGVVGLPPGRALVPAAIASGLWYAFLAVAGYALAENWEAAKALVADVNRVLAYAGLAAAGLLAFWIWRRTRKR